MLEAIREETQHPDHEDYGMFVLVIMSHGTEDECILGEYSEKITNFFGLCDP